MVNLWLSVEVFVTDSCGNNCDKSHCQQPKGLIEVVPQSMIACGFVLY